MDSILMKISIFSFAIYSIFLRMDAVDALMDRSAFILASTSVPTDLNFMPTLSNGHLGFTVFCNSIYVNGVYNGQGGESRRARIPNHANISILSVEEQGKVLDTVGHPLYTLDMKDGYFHVKTNYSGGVQIEERYYAHRYYDRALVYEIEVNRAHKRHPTNIKISHRPGKDSNAFFFTPEDVANVNPQQSKYKILKATTRTKEHPAFQKEPRTIYIVFSEDYTGEKTITVPTSYANFIYQFIMTIDYDKNVAIKEMNDVLLLKDERVLSTHTTEWKIFWNTFSIKVEDNMELQHVINAGIFYIANSLPSHHTNQPKNPYFGISPTGLGRGGLTSDYMGHNFWDTEVWMFPTILQMSPEWANSLLAYRLARLEGALFNANITGFKGARFPWETAYTGTECVQLGYADVAKYEIHITPDIAFALQQYFIATNDRNWLRTVAWPLMQEIGTFLESRVIFDAKTKKYHIKAVMGPDEDHYNIDDNIYTNVVSKIALEFASFTQKVCDPKNFVESSNNWERIARDMFILYDEKMDYHPQFVGYQLDTEVKQADVVLIGYPLLYDMELSTRFNDLNKYAAVTRETGPAMAWSMFSTNFLDVSKKEKADLYFKKGYSEYVRDPFKVWSEVKLGYSGAANFLTGIGGILQTIINGYGGIRLKREGLTSVMEIRRRYPLPDTKGFSLKGIKFGEGEFNLDIKANGKTTLRVIRLGRKEITLTHNEKEKIIRTGTPIELGTDAVELRTL